MVVGVIQAFQLLQETKKVFEKENIYHERGKRSASSVAGNAYHSALNHYFYFKKHGERIPLNYQKLNDLEVEESEAIIEHFETVKNTQYDLVDLEKIAFDYIDFVEPSKWKLQKTTPSIADCQQSASKNVTVLISNFFKEKAVYEDEIDEVLDVEVRFEEFVTINGVDIPLPCHGQIDLVVKTKDGKIVVIDHKSKKIFTDDKEISFSNGQQGITYAVGYETFKGVKVDEVWFIENKWSKNRDGSTQFKNKN